MADERQPPYVVSADVHPIMNRWSSTHSYPIPNGEYFQSLLSDLQNVLETSTGTDVLIVPETKLKADINDRTHSSLIPVISFDRVYIDPDFPNFYGYFEATRMVNEKFEDIGLKPRPEYPELPLQYDALTHLIRNNGHKEAILVDDVIFGGGGARDAIVEFRKRGVNIKKVIAGIAIKEGVELLEREVGVPVDTANLFESVIDEVCERDFRIGIPYSGRSVQIDENTHFSAPYVIPYGNAERWATIPENKAQEFSEFCVEQSIDLWSRIEKQSQSKVSLAVLGNERRVFLFKDMPKEISIVDALRSIKNSPVSV